MTCALANVFCKKVNCAEPLLLQYDVDLTITGHMHAYERIHPVANGEVTVNPVHFHEFSRVDVYYSIGKGPVHVMQGHAGGMQFERWISPIPAWSAYRMANGIVMADTSSVDAYGLPKANLPEAYNYSHTFGFGYITVHNASHLHYQAIPNVDGVKNHDEFWIVKERSLASL